MIYYRLDPKDITNIIGEVSSKKIMKDLNFTRHQLESFISRNKLYRGTILVEKEFKEDNDVDDKYLIFQMNGRKYYVTKDATFFVIYKNKNTKKLSVFKHKTKYMVKLGTKEYNAARIYARYYLKKDLNVDDCVIVKGQFDPKNIQIMNRTECARYTGSMAKVNRKIGLYIENRMVHEYRSSRQAAKELFCSYQTILDICHGKVKKKLYDVRFIEEG